MTRLLDHDFSSGAIAKTGWTIVGTGGTAPTISSTVFHSDAYSMLITPSGGQEMINTSSAQSAVGVDTYSRFYLYLDAAPSAFFYIFGTFNTVSCYVRLNTARTLSIASSSTVKATGTTVLALNTWYCVEVRTKVVGAATGEMEIRLNGVTEVATVNTMAMGTAAAKLYFGNISNATASGNFYFDDLAINSSAGAAPDNTWPGLTSSTVALSRTGSEALVVAEGAAVVLSVAKASVDLLGAADAASNTAALVRGATEALAWSDTAGRAMSRARPTTDATNVGDAPGRARGGARTATDSMAVIEAAARIRASARSQADAASILESAARLRASSRSQTDPATLGDATTRLLGTPRHASDPASSSDSAGGSSGSLSRAGTDTAAMAEAVARAGQRLRTGSDTLTSAESAGRSTGRNRATADGILVVESSAQVRSMPRAATDSATMGDAGSRGPLTGARSEADGSSLTNASARYVNFARPLPDALLLSNAAVAVGHVPRELAPAGPGMAGGPMPGGVVYTRHVGSLCIATTGRIVRTFP